jgi:hypothetical protein
MCTRLALALFVCVGMAPFVINGRAGVPQKMPTLEEAIRQWHKGMTSKKKEDREKSLRSMLPNQKDIDYLFPKHGEKLKPILAKGTAELLEHVEEIAKEMTKSGEIKSVETRDIREKDPNGRCKRLFEIIPKDVPVFDRHTRYVNGDGSGGEYYVYVNGRWLWIGGLDRFPEILDKLK